MYRKPIKCTVKWIEDKLNNEIKTIKELTAFETAAEKVWLRTIKQLPKGASELESQTWEKEKEELAKEFAEKITSMFNKKRITLKNIINKQVSL